MDAAAVFSLEGRTAVVSGCNTGLGRAMAVALAEAGADIVGLNRSEAAGLGEEIARCGRSFLDLRADLAHGAPAELVEQAAALTGRVDILVNNAGIIRRRSALEFSETDWDDVVDLNLRAVFQLSQAAARRFMSQGGGGKIINVASMLSFQGGLRVASYTASKSGVLGLTRALANEWAPLGINVNAIAPGYMSTNNTAELRADADRNDAILGRIPAGRWGRPEDLSGAVVFLASRAADYVHGHTLAVDGGWLAR
ncbi:2-dehydro-3-deoxy-D-gluconate 5-dehydrogenase KduD [Roseateles sp. NT4]|uniref:2-dehydro-3-deoxy-D-gluconate 5-dehydrogenase KduD n=1 Tax=Roseateles sp. NT4 TaxID=3453715 RepID=UPI003EEE4C99